MTADETRDAAAQMMAASAEISDPILKARAHMAMAGCHETYGQIDRAHAEYLRAAELARGAEAHSLLALVRYNHSALCSSVPNLLECLAILDEVDDLVDTYGLRRYLMSAGCQRAMATCLLGDVAGAKAIVAELEKHFAEGLDERGSARLQAH
jgi:hypothetical protein